MRRAVIALAVALVAATAAPARGGPLEDLAKGRDAYKAKDWESAAKNLNYILEPVPQLANTADLAEAYTLYGVSLYELGHRDRAKVQFEAVLALQPDKVLDSPIYSEGARRLFDEVREDLAARARREAELRKIEEEKERLRKFRESLVVYETHSYGQNFLPFGAGQFQNKHRRKGAVLAAGQVLTGGASLGIFLYLASTYGFSNNNVPRDDGPRVRRLQQLEIASGAAFFGLWAYGVIDALIHYQPRRRVSGDNSLLPDDAAPAPAPRKKTSFRDRVRLHPWLAPGGGGLGLSWEN